MKTSNKKKIVVSTLALAMGAALAGSISGSVAWYQYSTRATASLSGTSAGTSRNLQIAKTLTNAAATDNLDDGNWGWDVDLGSQNLKPVSPVMTDGFPSAFKSHAVRQYAELSAADGDEFISSDLYFQSIDETGAREAVEVYLETFEVTYSGDKKLDEAIRVAISDGTHVWLASKTALSEENATVTEGQLDLNDDGVNDRWIFEADDNTGLASDSGTLKKVLAVTAVASDAEGELKEGGSLAGYYTTAACSTPAEGTAVKGTTYYKFGSAPSESKTEVDGDYIIYYSGDETGSYETIAWEDLESDFDTAYSVTEGDGHFKFSTLTTTAAHLQVKIWLDGFAKVDGENIWLNTLIGEEFSVKMRFQTVAEK